MPLRLLFHEAWFRLIRFPTKISPLISPADAACWLMLDIFPPCQRRVLPRLYGGALLRRCCCAIRIIAMAAVRSAGGSSDIAEADTERR